MLLLRGRAKAQSTRPTRVNGSSRTVSLPSAFHSEPVPRCEHSPDCPSLFLSDNVSDSSAPSAPISAPPPLTPSQELALLLEFLTVGSGKIPPSVDPSLPLDAALLLDDPLPSGEDAQGGARQHALDSIARDIWTTCPVFVIVGEGERAERDAVEIRRVLTGEALLGRGTEELAWVRLGGRSRFLPSILIVPFSARADPIFPCPQATATRSPGSSRASSLHMTPPTLPSSSSLVDPSAVSRNCGS